ncbi:MAG TPA: hypothetical protein VFV52_11625 [Bacilli bacterium]|nr:hypothetical protein [Bacilli bacterium]
METFLLISNLALWAVVLIMLFVFFLFSKLVVDFLNRFQGAPARPVVRYDVGAKAPLFRDRDQHGDMIALAESNNRPTLLLFTMDLCQVCKGIVPEMNKLKQLAPDLRVIIVEKQEMNVAVTQPPQGVHFIRSNEIISTYNIKQVPEVYLLDESSTIVEKQVIKSFADIEAMLSKRGQLAS